MKQKPYITTDDIGFAQVRLHNRRITLIKTKDVYSIQLLNANHRKENLTKGLCISTQIKGVVVTELSLTHEAMNGIVASYLTFKKDEKSI